MLVDSQHCCSYVIDRMDHLVAVDEGWNQFALDNHGRAISQERVLRTSLWRHVAGLENRIIYKRILGHVRITGEPLRFPLRCDGPTCERHLEMSVEPLEDKGCVFTTTLEYCHARPRVALLDPLVARSQDRVSMCGWCMHIEVMGRGWHPTVDALQLLELSEAERLPQLGHTICPDCADRLERLITREAWG